jgi:branched-subunit amino acid aminotransferase/4-amino-4-deoxychorismate lyase
MAAGDKEAGYDFYSGKTVDPPGGLPVRTRLLDRNNRLWEGPQFPMDSEAEYAYYSRMGGFVPVEVAMDTIFTNPIHYGAGGFEGVRLMRTPYGDGFIELPHNIARFIYSSLAFNLSLVRQTMSLLEDPAIEHVEHTPRTPMEFFADSERRLTEDENIRMGVDIFYKDGRKVRTTVPFELEVRFDGEGRKFSMREMEAAMCSLAFLNKLARGGVFPEAKIDNIPGGYFRPVFWVSGEEGLKVPTVIKKGDKLIDKPLYFGIGTLPWGSYLDPSDGLDLLLAPFRRIDEAMPVRQKISGNYVNSTRNINMAAILGFGEILALNHRDEIVEGSAENIIILITEKSTGSMRAYCPPLSSNILAGTTRNRALKVLEEGISVLDKKVELVMEAPKWDFIKKSLKGHTGWEVSAIVLMGTGVGFVHGRSLTENQFLADWMEVNELRSEEQRPNPLVLKRVRETEVRYPINKGERHPFVDAIKKAYDMYVIGDNGSRITSAYSMDYHAAERIFGVQLNDVAGPEFIAKTRDGYFNERVNGVRQPEELISRYKEAAAVIRKMNAISIQRRSRPLGERGQWWGV